MRVDGAVLAADNNAQWCHAVCRAHGCDCEFRPEAWLNRGTPPPYYSNLVTLGGPSLAREHLHLIRECLEAHPASGFGFKDSFCGINLNELPEDRRAALLFEASWIRLDSSRWRSRSQSLDWRPVDSTHELRAFEAAWRGEDANEDADPGATQFPSALLSDPEIAFLAGWSGVGRIEGVAIANRTADVVGLSNVFGSRVALPELWAGATEAAMSRFPALPLVGYERGDDLVCALNAGFECVGDLRVVVVDPIREPT